MARFNECLHGDLSEIGDTGELSEAELRALVQNLCQRVIRLESRCDHLRDRVASLGAHPNA